MVNGKSIYLGSYKKPKKAHEAYKKAAEKYFGEFAYTFLDMGANHA